MSIEESLDSLPPIQPGASAKVSTRQFQLRLPTDTFLKLEMDAARRGTTSYKLGATLVTMWVNGKLVIKTEEPKDNAASVSGPSVPSVVDQ